MATRGSLRLDAHFDCFHVDLNSGELLRSGTRVPIQDQPLQVLRLLLEAEGRVVTREQLRSALWPEDTFVDFEHGVNTAVKKLRQALGDSVEQPKFVETLPKIGYRFLVSVEWVPNGPKSSLPNLMAVAPPEPKPVLRLIPPKRSWKWKAAVGLTSLALLVAILFLSVSRLRHLVIGSSPESRPNLSQRRLTANPEAAPLTAGILSPDGKYLAYSDPRGFYLRLVDSGETHALPMPKGFDPLPESWFPDNIHMVVSSFGDQRIPFGSGIPRSGPPSLWEISVLGGTPRKLTDRGSSARVSPDGSKIAFLAGPWDDEEIWLAQADGNGARKLVDGGRDDFGAVAWAPDGKAFAWVRTIRNLRPERPPKRIELYDLTTGRNQAILSDPLLGDHIAWTKNGRLFYSLEEAEPDQADSNLWSIELDNRTWRPSGPPRKITNDHGYIGGISIAENNNRMALLRRTTQPDVYLAEVDPQSKRLNTLRRFTLDDRADWPNAWTVDNKSVLFRSDRDGPVQIYKQSITETQPEILVNGSKDYVVGGPRLTGDGLSVLYTVNDRPESSNEMRLRDPIVGSPSHSLRLMRAPIAGGAAQFVLEETGITNFQCATPPYTLCIYGQLESTFPYHKFFIFDPTRGKGKEILIGKMKNEDGPNFWTLSPDGKHIVTAKSQNPYDQPALRIFDVATGAEQSLDVPDIGLMIGMDWAADSKSIWLGGYMGRGAWGTRSGILNVDLTGKVRVGLKGLNPEILYAIPSPDGKKLALMGQTRSSNMWLVENF